MECIYCKKQFKRVSTSKECSLKCKILSRINIIKKTGCWEWNKPRQKTGYGTVMYESKVIPAHRASYLVFKGEISKGLLVCHLCDNRKCVNPDHLWLGTCSENMIDCSRKGRLVDNTGRKRSHETIAKLKLRPRPDKRGEKHHLTKLTNESVLDIRKSSEIGILNCELAIKYNVSKQTIADIIKRKTWAHI